MHTSALQNARRFFNTYAGALPAASDRVHVVEIGSANVNGSLREVCPPGVRYTGLDFAAGPGVDIVLDDAYALPLADGCADIVVSSSCFEHSDLFWLVFLEAMRILAPHGLFYLNAPSNGAIHRYPVDCWRFYPDSGRALVTWGRRNGLACELLESWVGAREGTQEGDHWNDFVAIFLKDSAHISAYPRRILHRLQGFQNGTLHGDDRVLNPSVLTEDQLRMKAMAAQLRALRP